MFNWVDFDWSGKFDFKNKVKVATFENMAKILIFLFFSFTLLLSSCTEEKAKKKSPKLTNQQKQIIKSFEEERHIGIDYDTIIDLNFDGNKDFVLGYYGSTGSGLKNYIEAYFFDGNEYHYDTLLSSLNNPSFYLEDSTITSFYIGNGGGFGNEYKWNGQSWKEVKTVRVSYHYEDGFKDIPWYICNKKRARYFNDFTSFSGYTTQSNIAQSIL